jgi:hypothetical protein
MRAFFCLLIYAVLSGPLREQGAGTAATTYQLETR